MITQYKVDMKKSAKAKISYPKHNPTFWQMKPRYQITPNTCYSSYTPMLAQLKPRYHMTSYILANLPVVTPQTTKLNLIPGLQLLTAAMLVLGIFLS